MLSKCYLNNFKILKGLETCLVLLFKDNAIKALRAGDSPKVTQLVLRGRGTRTQVFLSSLCPFYPSLLLLGWRLEATGPNPSIRKDFLSPVQK